MMTETIRDELEIQRQSQQTQVVKGSIVVVDKEHLLVSIGGV